MTTRHLLECVPNFSEGRRPEVVDRIAAAARSAEGVKLLDRHSDADHNRSVLTLAGEAEPLCEAVFRAIRTATEQIDLRHHSGEHPRIGATDVVPFVPLGETPMAEAIAAAHALGRRVADELEIPVYFYEAAASRPERTNLEDVRRRGFEELRDAITDDEERRPDLGPLQVHPSAGAVAVGARQPLIAYNIYLNSNDLQIARAVARRVRHSSGGLRYVKALGFEIQARGQVQVSMNLTDYRKTAIHTVFNLVRDEAAAYGVGITDSEIVGLVPIDAVLDAARHYLRLHTLSAEQIVEMKLMDMDL